MSKHIKSSVAMLLAITLVLSTVIPSMVMADDGTRGNLLVLGDSIATGYGLSGYNAGKDPKAADSWTTLLAEHYDAKQYNYAEDGTTTSDLLNTIHQSKNQIAIAEADAICISIGGNDFLNLLNKYTDDITAVSGLSKEAQELLVDVSDDLDDIFTALKEKNPNGFIFVQTLFHPFRNWAADASIVGYDGTIGEWMETYIDAYNAILREKTQNYDFLCIDVAQKFKEEGAQNWIDGEGYDTLQAILADLDNIEPHPTKEGHQAIYEIYVQTANEALAEALNNYMDISTYRSGETYTHPKKQGFVFAGWYTDAEYTKPLSKTKTSGYAYAKFVDEKVLTVKFQIMANTTKNSEFTDLRILTSVDTLQYKEVGFDVTIYGKSLLCQGTEVYETVSAYVDNRGLVCDPSVFSEESEYFVTHRITKITNSAFSVPITVAPQWTTLDGTVVKGNEDSVRTIRIQDCFTDKPEEEQDTETIFSFDSYKQIFATETSLVNDFGATRINKEQNYLTEGAASWYIRPQGDYGVEGQYPFFRMKCYTGAFKTNNFDNYDKILLDIYNASDEEVVIEWKFKTKMQGQETTIDANECSYTLQPHAWNVLEYDLMDPLYSVKYDFSNVQYMTVRILSKKESKDDTMVELYLDNLRGHNTTNEREQLVMNSDFEQGLSMEKLSDRAYFRNENSYLLNSNILSRVAYKDTNVHTLSFMGEYALKGKATDSSWPKTIVEFDKTYAAGKYLNFMMYIEVDEELLGSMNAHLYHVYSSHDMVKSGGCFNRWVQISIRLTEACSSLEFYPELQLGGAEVNIYMDCFVISNQMQDFEENLEYDFTAGITFEEPEEMYAIMGSAGENMDRFDGWSQSLLLLSRTKFDGSYVMKGTTAVQYPEICMDFGKEYEAGTILTFRVYVQGTTSDGVTALPLRVRTYAGDSKWQQTNYDVNIQLNKWNDITITCTEAFNRAGCFIELANNSVIADGKAVNIYYDDFAIGKKLLRPIGEKEWTADDEAVTKFESWY